MTRSRTAAVLGGVVGLVGFGFVVQIFVERREETGDILARSEVWPLACALVLGLAGMSIIGAAWNKLLGLLDHRIPTAVAYRSYFVGQLGKYVPGGVWAVVGRGEWARRSGVTAAAAYSSTVLSMVTAYLAAAVVTAGLLPITATQIGFPPLALLVGGLGVIGVPLLHPRVMEPALTLLRRISRKRVQISAPPFPATMGIVAMQAITWVCIGTGTWLIAWGFGADVSWPVAMVATAASWVIGMLVLPVPGGIGIREGAFVALLQDVPEAAAIALAARLVAVAVDGMGAAVSTLAAGRSNRVAETHQ